MGPLTELETLRFYREEVRHEFGLLAMRSTMLVTCQSFLIVPFAILHTAPSFRRVLVPLFLIEALGLLVAVVLREPINAAHRTIGKWLVMQRALLQQSETLRVLALDRDLLEEAVQDPDRDEDHARSLAFSRLAPWAFVGFWVASAIWTVVGGSLGP